MAYRMAIQYVVGDATAPIGDGIKIIAHVCNDVGVWGAGFVLALSDRWSQPEEEYRKLSRPPGLIRLGRLQLVPVEENLWVANMIAQHGVRAENGVPPIRYDELDSCLEILAYYAEKLAASVHMPRIGCGLAGGEWEKVEPLIEKHLVAKGIPVTVYDLPKG